MAKVVRHFVEQQRKCAYLPEPLASLEYKLMVDVQPDEFEVMMLRGWRRFGPAYFRPACQLCTACDSLRIDVHRFTPTPSQSRALRRNRRFRVEFGRPTVDDQRLALHNAWHATRETARGWEGIPLTEEDYANQFAFPSLTGREMAWYDGERLVAIGLVDVTKNCFSAAYFFYHPDIARLSPGIGNVMMCIEMARDLGAQHVYLGYRVLGCASLTYKGQFQPHEVLVGLPAKNEEPKWVQVASVNQGEAVDEK